jgi:uncharacterized protein YaiE (UPF0345 family)
MPGLDKVSVLERANIYFDGKCVSHTAQCADGSRKSVGVVFPSLLIFSTGAPGRMEIVAGRCRMRLAGCEDWRDFAAGTAFDVPGNGRFEIEVSETVDCVCHFG